MSLIDIIYPKYNTISIVGTAKNAGKTVCLNEIIAQSERKHIILGLISTGRDGERRDVLTDTEKPLIYVKKGTIITTVESRINSGHRNKYAAIEILSVTDYTTPIGRVVLGRAMEDGYVEISGPRSALTIKQMCDDMVKLGAQLILIDGSLDRRASAAPYVSQGTILATGASLSRNIDDVIQKTKYILKIYSTPELEQGHTENIVRDIFKNSKTAVVSKDNRIKYIDTITTLQCGSLISEKLDEDTAYVVLSGSATTDTIKQILLNKKSDFRIVVKDATRFFLSHMEYSLLKKMGMELRVVESLNIIAITLNPYSPDGYCFDCDEFLSLAKKEITQVPVFDVFDDKY